MNHLTSAGVLAEDKLFATLDTTARALKLPDGRTVLLIDTVGLVRRLPHHLVDAFRSTLEEAAEADVILNLCDISNPEAAEHLTVTRDLLVQLGRGDRPVLTVFNKCDRPAALPALEPDGSQPLCISAITGRGVDKLLDRIVEALPPNRRRVSLLFPFDKGALAGLCRRDGAVEYEEYVPEGLRMTVTISLQLLEQVREYLIEE